MTELRTAPTNDALADTDILPIAKDEAGTGLFKVTLLALKTFIGSGGGGGGSGKYRFGFSIETSAPEAGEVLLRHVAQTDVNFADDFAGSQARKSPGGSNPATDQIFGIKHNGSNIGSVTFATTGAVSFATTGADLTIEAGDEIRIEAPVTPDNALVGFSLTLFGQEV